MKVVHWRKFLIRDVLVVIAAIIALATLQNGTAAQQVFVGVVVGVCAYLFHEWAHWLGAWLVDATVVKPDRIFSPFLFSFDSRANTYAQFLAMTWPGFLATATYMACFYFLLPWQQSLWAMVALILGAMLAFATVVIEGPILLYALWKRSVPPVEIPFIGNNTVLQSLLSRVRG